MNFWQLVYMDFLLPLAQKTLRRACNLIVGCKQIYLYAFQHDCSSFDGSFQITWLDCLSPNLHSRLGSMWPFHFLSNFGAIIAGGLMMISSHRLECTERFLHLWQRQSSGFNKLPLWSTNEKKIILFQATGRVVCEAM